ncbi:MAG: AI-2E family transporter [Bdellovibrionales bacterium]
MTFFGDGLAAATIKNAAMFFDVNVDLELIKSKLLEATRGGLGHFLTSVNSFVGNVFSFLFDLVIMMIVVFGILVNGENLKKYLFELSPLPDYQEQIFLDKFNQMNYATLVCNGLGHTPRRTRWSGTLDRWYRISYFIDSSYDLFSIYTSCRISIVTIPASLYLILTGQVTSRFTLLAFTTTVALVVEQWFKPRFIGGRIQINSIFVLLTIIGGMAAFGMGGIFYGPIIGILFLTIVDMYHDQYQNQN